jgi:hypothetical protein
MRPVELTPSALRPERILQGLTHAQEAYVLARFNGLGISDAYREAYPNQDANAATIARSAHDLETSPKIVARFNQMIADRRAQSSLAPIVSKEFVLNGIASIAANPNVKDQTRLAAYIALGKVAGIDLFREIHVTEKRTRTPEEIDAELRERLASMAQTIDVTPNPAPPPAAAPGRGNRRRKTEGV